MMTYHLLGYTVLLLLWASCTEQNAECEPPPRRDYEQLSDKSIKEVYSQNDTVIYTCRPGYIQGRIRYKCNNGRWDQLTFTECKKKPCGHPGDIQFGSFELKNEEAFVFGARVVYHCDDGYQMVSQRDYRDCRVDGWSNDVPHCEVRKCLPVAAPEHGRIIMTGIQNVDDEYLFGQVVRFECTGTFRINGSEQIVCTNKGEWSAPVPKCIEITCQPGTIERGYITSPDRVYKENEVLQFACDPGYKYVERSDTRCTQNGWYPRPACTEIVCSTPGVGNGRFNPRQEQYRNEDEIHIQCEEGFRLEQGGQMSRCTENGWSPSPKCIKKPCDIPTIKNGHLSDHYRYYGGRYFPKRVGQTVEYRCQDGFLTLNKDYWSRSTCRDFGWDPQPQCFRKCIPPRSLPHGTLTYSYWGTFIEEDEISFSCADGYYPVSPEGRAKCTKDGWAPTLRCAEIVTCKIKDPLNGFFHERSHVFALHERTTYGCQNDYTTPKGLDRGETQCLEEGWTPKPECIKTCQKPPEGNMIFINATKSVFYFMEKLVYQCKDGYETSKSTIEDHSVCTQKGWNPKPDCRQIQCDIPYLDHGRIQPRKDRYFEGDVVQFSCLRATRVGSASAQCYHFGWSPPLPICKDRVNPCSAPSGISDGKASDQLQEEYQHGATVEYECNARFAMVGSSRVECVDGEWTTLPYCTAAESCGPPPNITNGHPASEDGEEYFHGDTMSYRCAENTISVGPNPAKCLHGKWELPSCVDGRANCAPPKLPTNAIFASDPLPNYKTNSIVSYSCGSDRHKTKCVNGKWSPEPQCKGLCPPPPQLPNAIIQMRKSGSVEKIHFKCKEYFQLQGSKEIECENGKWQTPPRCLDLSCGDPPAIENGDVKGNRTERRYPPGRPVEYQCHEGFEIGGISSVTCRNREWSEPPTCNEKRCRDPPTVHDSSVKGTTKTTYRSGETVTYECHPGFGADRPLTVTCQRGEWTEPPICEDTTCQELPTIENADVLRAEDAPYLPGRQVQYQCHEGFNMSGSDTITCENKRWSKPPVCKDATCPPPPPVEHGNLDGQQKERYLPFEKVRYRCDPGKSLFGPQSVTCLNKQWTEKPECRAAGGKCGRPPVIENGDILEAVVSQFPPNSVVNYKCQSYYIMHGQSRVRCTNGHWTEAPTCIAPCTVSEEDMLSNKIQLRWKSAGKLYSESGDAVEFSCRHGFHPDPSSPPFRLQCIEGKLEYPRCIKFCTVNEQIMRSNNIVFKVSSETQIPSGYVVEFICKFGYRNARTSPPFRVTCGESNLVYPRCIRG